MLKARATEQLVFPISSSSPPTATRIEQTLGAGRMAQQLKDLAALPEDSGLSPNAYISTLVPGHLIPSLASQALHTHGTYYASRQTLGHMK